MTDVLASSFNVGATKFFQAVVRVGNQVLKLCRALNYIKVDCKRLCLNIERINLFTAHYDQTVSTRSKT